MSPGPRVGWYVHHQGSGHRHRAGAVARVLAGRGAQVTALSSAAEPAGWPGDWVELARDDAGGDLRDVDARGALHFAPLGDPGLRARTAQVSAWIERVRPDVLVSDVSVEIALLARLHGVPVVSVVLPGRRDDAPHRLGHQLSAALVSAWPAEAVGMVEGLTPEDLARLQPVGGLSRFGVRCHAPDGVSEESVRRPGPPRVTVLLGDGGGQAGAEDLAAAAASAPGWEWTILGRGAGTWVDDPFAVLCDSDVVVTHAGQNAVAEVAAARRPAVIIPAVRPHAEQETTGRVLADPRWPVRVERAFPRGGWAERLAEVAAYDGAQWAPWTDDGAAERLADVVLTQTVTSSQTQTRHAS